MANALLYYLIVINILTLAVYGIDKWRSTSGRLLPTGRKKGKQGGWRISEESECNFSPRSNVQQIETFKR